MTKHANNRRHISQKKIKNTHNRIKRNRSIPTIDVDIGVGR